MPEILTVAELAALLKISRSHVYVLVKSQSNPLPALRLGTTVRFRKVDVDAWLQRLSESNKAA
ncbi:MAG: helix-turn-helix domain-containing protein [Candidatus Sulfotelmatobacter sp.]|jgi:excisionase family DNA binding protein